MNIYALNSYREVIRESLLDRKGRLGRDFTFAKLAKACRLQRTYLSAVLLGNGHLSLDQVYLAGRFLGFGRAEMRFTSVLNEWERSDVKERRAELATEIARLRREAMQSDDVVAATPLATPAEQGITDFYLDLNAQLIHMFLTVKARRQNPEDIRAALGIDRSVFWEAIRKAESAGLIRVNGKAIEVLRDSFHLPDSSSLYPNYRMQMRLKALEHMQRRANDDHRSFSVLYSSNAESRDKIWAKFLDLISWAQTATQGDEPTHVFQINFDLLTWG